MTAVVDTSVLIDVLRGHAAAGEVLERERESGPLLGSEVTRLEVLAGMRPKEERATRRLFEAVSWHAVDEEIAEIAGELGQRWLPGHRTIDSADLAIAATAVRAGCSVLTRNVKHFPMFPDLRPPY